jgi:CubicO group peptidase (beta-lactamase class C family)
VKLASFPLFPLFLLAAAALPALASSPDPRIGQVETALWPALVTEATKPWTLAERMRHHRVPGVSIAVVEDGRLVWARAWGVAMQGEATPLTPDTLLQAGSVSKAVAALGALKLAEQGRLDLDADVNTLLKSWKLSPGAQTAERPVTVRGILGHTAGLTVHGFPGTVPGQPVPTLRQILDGQPPARTAAVRASVLPGREWRYSGGGYVLLQQLMGDVTGEPFAAWMRREILHPAGMATSRFGALPADTPLAQAAAGHTGGQVIEGRRATMVEEAAGGLWTTPTELVQLALGLQRTMAGDAQPWIAPRRLAEALRPNATVPQARSGLGFFLHGRNGFGHDGRNAGFDSRWAVDGRRAIAIMVNANSFGLIDELMRAVAVAHGWDDVAPRRITLAELRAGFEAAPIFLRGSMNGWSATTRLVPTGDGRFAVEIELPAGRHEFKFGSDDWQRIDLGAGAAEPATLAGGGANLVHETPAPGRWRFTLDARDPAAPRYAVEPASPRQPS